MRNGRKLEETVTVSLIFFIAGFLILFYFDRHRTLYCKGTEKLCQLKTEKLLGGTSAETFTLGDINRVEIVKHDNGQGYMYKVYLSMKNKSMLVEVFKSTDESRCETVKNQIESFKNAVSPQDLAVMNEPDRGPRIWGCGMIIFSVIIFVSGLFRKSDAGMQRGA